MYSSENVYEIFICDEIKKYVTKKASQYICKEEARPTRTRREGGTNKKSILATLESYVLSLWDGISKRLQYCDLDGTTNWSEAPAEGVFSILGFIIENKPGLSIKLMFELCRIVKEGPAPATKAAVNISKNGVKKWQGKSSNDNLTFISDK